MRRALAAIVLALLSGCAWLQSERTPNVPPPPAAAARGGEDLLAYMATLRGMGEPALNREIARQRQLLAREASDMARTRLAIALTLSAPADEAEILGLVDPVARKETAPADVRAVASFLHSIVSDRRRLRESATAANARLRDERRAVEAQKQRADTLQERAAQLQQKLDGLTELEKSLSDRPSQSR
jgi:hypothetical protein